MFFRPRKSKSKRRAELLRPVQAHLAPAIDGDGGAHVDKLRIHQVGAMPGAFDPARHRVLGALVPGSDVFSGSAESIARALDALPRLGTVAAVVVEVVVARHVLGVPQRRFGKRLVPGYRPRRREQVLAAIARGGASLVDEVEYAAPRGLPRRPRSSRPRHSRRGNIGPLRERRRRHDPELARVKINAEAHFFGPFQLLPQGYDAIKEWMKDNKKTAAGAAYEIYITDPIDKNGKPVDPYKIQTDIIFPIK